MNAGTGRGSGAIGGRRPGAGRPIGSRNSLTLENGKTLRELAAVYSAAAIEALSDIASNGHSESARVGAACALLDRAYGRPSQAVELAPSPQSPAWDLSALTRAELESLDAILRKLAK